jgi:adenylate cyclase
MAIENARQLSDLMRSNKTLLAKLQQTVQEQEKTLRLFMKYVPEPVIEKTLTSSEEALFSGEHKTVAILFCDIRGFTPMCEQLAPKEVVSFLNDYYAIMSEAIKRHNGTVIQYVGDEIFAAFGAPVAIADMEKNAVFCGMEMMRRLEVLNGKYRGHAWTRYADRHRHQLQRSGGPAIWAQYKIVTPSPATRSNTGKRIETITKDFPNSILMSEAVYQIGQDFVPSKEFAPLTVKGKKEPIRVYQILLNAE